jgi:MFS transporter, putative metabolite:H+ symporter
LTVIGYLLGPETKGKELKDLADEALADDSELVKSSS